MNTLHELAAFIKQHEAVFAILLAWAAKEYKSMKDSIIATWPWYISNGGYTGVWKLIKLGKPSDDSYIPKVTANTPVASAEPIVILPAQTNQPTNPSPSLPSTYTQTNTPKL